MTGRVKLDLSAECVTHLERALMWRLARLSNLEKSARARGDLTKADALVAAHKTYLAALREWNAAMDAASLSPLAEFMKNRHEGGGA